MRVTIDVDTNNLEWVREIKALGEIFKAWADLYDKSEPVKADPKEEKATLDTVKTIIKEPAAPEPKPKKDWNAKQKQDIQAIKDAYINQINKRSNKANNFRKDIDDSLIIYMKDEQGKTLKQIARELGCCEQTVLNRYNKAKKR